MTESSAVIVAGGVGYRIFATQQTLARLEPGAQAEMSLKQIVRENEISLYGFAGPAERRLFELLITTSGLGPKLGLALLDDVGEEKVVQAILDADAQSLTRATGIGQKLAQKICLELGDKMRDEALLGKVSSGGVRSGLSDVIEALVALGHRRSDAERAAALAKDEAGDAAPQKLIPIALKYASSK
ncbi:MAG: Holliday junction branch migration protein RuvA [Armatimonadota bacterium]|nr:Holliday junction branch migration protein RuvA [Armatimonadota bacterium]